MIAEVRDWLKGKPVKRRSKDWPKVRKLHLMVNPTCAACGGNKRLEVHHIKVFHEHPDLELSRENLITLCEEPARGCHYVFGHLSTSWKASNSCVREDAETHLRRIQEWRGRQ